MPIPSDVHDCQGAAGPSPAPCWRGLHFRRSTRPFPGLLLCSSPGGHSPRRLHFSLPVTLVTNVPFGNPGVGCAQPRKRMEVALLPDQDENYKNIKQGEVMLLPASAHPALGSSYLLVPGLSSHCLIMKTQGHTNM